MNRIRPNERIIEEDGERYAISIFSGNGKLYDQMQLESPDILAPRRGSLVYRHLGSIAGESICAEVTSSQLQVETHCIAQPEAAMTDLGAFYPDPLDSTTSPQPMSEYLRLADANL